MRSASPEMVNAIANAPDVRQMMFLGMRYPDDMLDFGGALENPNNVALEEDGFCALFCWTSPSVYECHIMARKEARGVASMRIGHEMLDHMRGLGAKRVWGQPSVYNRAAICYIRRMGLTSRGLGEHPVLGAVHYFEKDL